MPWNSVSKHLPKIEPKKAWDMPHTNLTKLIVNKTVTFRGRVHEGAEWFIISLENLEGMNLKKQLFIFLHF